MKNKIKSTPLKFNIFVIFLAMALGLNLVMAMISYSSYQATIDNEIQRISLGMSNAIASGINGNRVDDWLSGKRLDEYRVCEDEIENFDKSNHDVRKITVCKMFAEEMQVIFEIENGEAKKNLKEKIPYFETIVSAKSDLVHGYQIAPIRHTVDGEEMIIAFAPVKSTTGEVKCYVICEMSLSHLTADSGTLAKTLTLTLIIAGLIICVVYLYWVGILVYPISRIASALKRYASDSKSLEKTKKVLSAPRHNRINELAIMNSSFLKLVDVVNVDSERVEKMNVDIIADVARMVNKRNIKDTSNTDAVKKYTMIIFDNLLKTRKFKRKLTERFMDAVLTAIPLYDLGEISISDDILNKDGKLTDAEFEAIKHHTEDGKAIITNMMGGSHDEYYIDIAVEMAQFHHERWDGSGYMGKLKGNKIPLSARIIAVADVFNALVSNKSYRKRKTVDEALEIIKDGRKQLFDKDIVDAFLAGEERIRSVARIYETSNTDEEAAETASVQ